MGTFDFSKIRQITLPERETRAFEFVREVSQLNSDVGGVPFKEALIIGAKGIEVSIGADYTLNHWLFLYELGVTMSNSDDVNERAHGEAFISQASEEIEKDNFQNVNLYIYI